MDIILATIKNSFRHCALLYIKSSYFLLICSDEPIRARALPQFKAGHEIYDNLLVNEGIIPEWLKYQLLTDDVLSLVVDTDAPLNESDYPALEFEMARLSGRGIPDFKQRLRQAMDLEQIGRAVGQTKQYPAELVWHTMLRLKNSSFTRRWKELARQYDGDFEISYHAVQQYYMKRLYASGSNANAFHRLGYRLMKPSGICVKLSV